MTTQHDDPDKNRELSRIYARHTPTPWDHTGLGVIVSIGTEKDFPLVCDTAPDETASARNLADASYIVRAVNAHEELVEALTLLFEDWQTLTNQDYNEGNEDVSQIDQKTRTALAKAKGETT